jgi:hypothetical protein
VSEASVTPPQARIAPVLIQYLPSRQRDAVLQLAQRELSQDAASRDLFCEAYEVAGDFSFSSEYVEKREVTWLGKAGPRAIPGHPELGTVTANHVMVWDGVHNILSLHQHLALSASIPLAAGDPALAAAIRALHELYWLKDRVKNPSLWAPRVDPFGSLVTHDGAAIFSRRALYLSVLLSSEDSGYVEDWHDLSPALWGLINLQAEGVDRRVARSSLEEIEYRSAAFYVGFVQPEGALTLAVPYPDPALTEPWPELLPGEASEAAATSSVWARRRAALGDRFEAYDLSPEYPALRYNAMALLAFAGGAAYAESKIRHRLVKAMSRPRLIGLLMTARASRGIDQLYYQARSLSMLLLPAMRETAARLLRSRIMADAPREIDGMRASLTNGLLALLAGVTMILAALQVILVIFDH